IRTLSLAALENDTDADAGILCSFWLALYKDPLERVDTLTVELSALSAADQATLAQVELLTLASIDFHPPGGGSAISQLCAVEKLDYSLDVSASSYRMTIGFMNMANVP
ncbi:MAG: hypothetical protein ACRDRD_21280, partial [Pseudonocardiaceae bacterium]